MTPNDHPRRPFRFPWRSAQRIQTDIDDELRFHIDMRTAELTVAGMSEAAARQEAMREFGDVEFTKRYCRRLDEGGELATRRADWLADARHDIAQAVRVLRRSPGFLLIALVTIALGVGANSAIFSVIRGVLLRPLPFADPGRLVSVYEDNRPEHSPRSELAAGDYVDYQRDQSSFTDIGVVGYASLSYQGEGDPVALRGLRFSPNVFTILGVRPLLGRTFTASEDRPGTDRVIVLSFATWQNVFGGDANIVGRKVRMSGSPMTIVGVMPRGFTFGGTEQFWSSFDLQPQLGDVNRARKFHNMVGVARLRTGITLQHAKSDLLTIAHRNEIAHPASNKGHLVDIVPLPDALVGDVRVPLLVLAGAAFCVLLIACANLANLLFSRTLGRQRELAVRAALGAERGRLVRQLLTESLILALLGGVAGSIAGWAGTRALLSVAPDALPPTAAIRIDPWVIAFALAMSLGGGLLFGLLPAWMGATGDMERTLRETGRAVSGRRSDRLRTVLVTAQTALTVILLAGAGLLVRSLDRLQQVALGFDGRDVLLAQLELTGKAYDAAGAARFYESLFERLRAAPDVRRVGAGTSVPFRGSWSAGLRIDGEAVPNGPLPSIGYTEVNDDYFRALSIPLRRGRTFVPQDVRGGPTRAVILNEEAVRRFWPTRDALGARIQLGPDPRSPWYIVVGIVGNVRQDGFDAQTRPVAYTSYRQEGETYLTLAIRTTGDPLRVVPELRAAVRELDKTVPLTDITTMDSVAGDSLARRRFSMLLLSVFAIVSLVLAIVGTYGVTAYMVSARTPELGVRIALGATSRDILALVVGRSSAVSMLGVGIGLLGAVLSSSAIRGMLYGTSPTDVTTLASVAVVLLVASLAAALIPARRALRVDPVETLRRD